METKICTVCEKEKNLDEFRKGRGYRNGIRSSCKDCDAAALKRWRSSNPEKYKKQWDRDNLKRKNEGRGNYDPENRELIALQRRNAYLLRKYGITLDEYLSLREKQKGLCAICEGPPQHTPGPGQGRKPELVVDHCHKNGHVRALLCDRCNRALGVVDDNPDLLAKLANYLITDR